MRKFWIVFIALLCVIGGVIGFLWEMVASVGESVDVPGGVLVWRAEGGLPEDMDSSFIRRIREGDQPTLAQVALGIRRAAGDPDIVALLIDLRAVEVSWAKLEELRAAVLAFRQTGKPVWACLEQSGATDYALAVAAEHVALAPEGGLAVLGVAAELAFIKDTLAKVGIAADFVSVGKYKSAPEQYTRSEASPESREVIESIVDARYEVLAGIIATGRSVAPDFARAWIDTGLFDPPTALAAGLVDTLATAAGLLDGLFGDEDVTYLEDYARAVGQDSPHGATFALITASGTIMEGESEEDPMQGRVLGSDTLVDQLERARDDEDVAAVILRVDSPGGSVLASDLIWRAVASLREEKPVIVSMSTYAASGGYYISCGADSIFADPSTLTGSIGVFAGKLDWSGLYEKIGVNREFVTRGENALMFSDATGFSPAQRVQFQAQLDRFYERFLAKVGAGRGMQRDQVHAVAQGRVWTGAQAVDIGLVDELGGLDRAILAGKLKLGIDPLAEVRLQTYGEELSWLQRFILDSLNETSLAVAIPVVPAEVVAAGRYLSRCGFLTAMPLLDGRPLALAPVRIVDE